MDRFNDAEIERALRSMEILVDTREKKWGHIGAALDALCCPYERQKLDFGDIPSAALIQMRVKEIFAIVL